MQQYYDFEWGAKRVPLTFDRPPYDGAPDARGYEPEILNVVERFLEPGDVAVDAGASIGFHTCFMSRLVGETGLVFAFEPHLESFGFLANHVHLVNKLNNVALANIALWKETAEGMILYSVKDIGYSSLHRYKDGVYDEIVRGAALDDLLGPEDHPRVIKIDTEGTEAEVLLGARKMLERGVDAVILELNYFMMYQVGRSDKPIRAYMDMLGYDMFLINIAAKGGSYEAPIKVAPDLEMRLRGGHHINVLFSTEEKVKERWEQWK